MNRRIPMRNEGRLHGFALACGTLLLVTAVAQCSGQIVDVTLRVEIVGDSRAHRAPSAPSAVVAWLNPTDAGAYPSLYAHTYQMAQKDKTFDPHLLVLQVGSIVEFPNRDPFFHNVFSLFNGKRFDLGLYEAGGERRVRFDREGVSYIFCNIHPEMGAVILSLATPYYAVSREGEITIPHVPPGKYLLNLWSEGATLESMAAARREITVPSSAANLGSVSLTAAPSPIAHHANKFGESYPALDNSSPYSAH